MREGRLVWHRSYSFDMLSYRPGYWYTHSMDEFELMRYDIKRTEEGWRVTAMARTTRQVFDLGTYSRLRKAKAAADGHHHKLIERDGSPELRAYIARYAMAD